MIFSKRILELAKSPRLFKRQLNGKHKLTLYLDQNAADLEVSFDTFTTAGELCVSNLCYSTSLSNDYLGILDAFFSLVQNRPLEAIDRFPSKELERFLRDDPLTPALSHLDEKYYEILAIGEEIKNLIAPKVSSFAPRLPYPFLQMPLAEQLEFLEEICAHYLYPKMPVDSMIEFIDLTERRLEVVASDEELLREFELLLQRELADAALVVINTNHNS